MLRHRYLAKASSCSYCSEKPIGTRYFFLYAIQLLFIQFDSFLRFLLIPFTRINFRVLSFIVDFRINETLQIGAVGNSAYRVEGESVCLFFQFTIVPFKSSAKAKRNGVKRSGLSSNLFAKQGINRFSAINMSPRPDKSGFKATGAKSSDAPFAAFTHQICYPENPSIVGILIQTIIMSTLQFV